MVYRTAVQYRVEVYGTGRRHCSAAGDSHSVIQRRTENPELGIEATSDERPSDEIEKLILPYTVHKTI